MRAVRCKYLRRECKARFPSTIPVQLYGQDWWSRVIPLTLTHAPGTFRRKYRDIKRGRDPLRTFMPGTARRAK